jgi:hypothetical protein
LDAIFVGNYINTSVLQFFEFSFLIGAMVGFQFSFGDEKIKMKSSVSSAIPSISYMVEVSVLFCSPY